MHGADHQIRAILETGQPRSGLESESFRRYVGHNNDIVIIYYMKRNAMVPTIHTTRPDNDRELARGAEPEPELDPEPESVEFDVEFDVDVDVAFVQVASTLWERLKLLNNVRSEHW